MIVDTLITREATTDTELVARTLDGDSNAFEQIVSRYQSLICSLTFSATGSLGQSQDLAQETFITAWKHLRLLREREKLRAWLCGIARRLIGKALRSHGHEPVHKADPLETIQDAADAAPLPSEHVITREEEAILWRSIERIPGIYREPLVLFYREHQSVETVAASLDLSEDAVKQRLSRGRKLLQQEVLSFIEGALERTSPGKAFTIAVLAGLPVVASSSAAAASVGVTVASKAGATAKAGLGMIALNAFAGKLLPAALGFWMLLKLSESKREKNFVRKAYAVMGLGAILFTLVIFLGIRAGGSYWDSHPQALTVGLLAAAFGFVAVAGPYSRWVNRVQRRIREEETGKSPNPSFSSQSQPYEYRSRQTFLGLPWLHIRLNCVQAGRTLPAKGWIAIGNRAYGILFAGGTVAVGGISSGPLAVGALAVGGFGIGLFAFGGLAIGLAAVGGAALGYVALGGGAVGWLGASGGAALARHFAVGGGALAAHANDRAAQAFMQSSAFFRHAEVLIYTLIAISSLVAPAVSLAFKRWRERACRVAQQNS